jgi:N-acetylglucosaminyldiphosphoundecaprenol N-acetyl-beta-D-mannosaminyltransferase
MRRPSARAGGGGIVRPVERTVMLGVPLACLGMDDTVEWIDHAVASRTPHQVATANLNFLALGQRDPGFLRILQDASLVTCDGMPLCWVSRVQRTTLRERVTGADLVPRLCERAARRGYRLFFLGPPGSTEEAARRLRARYPGLQIVGCESPPYGPIEAWDNARYCERIREAATDLLFVGLGAPKQERWLAAHLRASGAPVGIGVGATFDYVAGRVRRAPRVARAVGLEWAWRIAVEPRRLWRRYLYDAAIAAPRLTRQLWASRAAERRSGNDGRGQVRLRMAGRRGEVAVLSLVGSFPRERLAMVRRATRGVRGGPLGLVLDLTEAGFLAPTVLGDLTALVGWVRSVDGQAALVASPGVRRQLEAAGLGELAPFESSVTEAVGRLVRGGDRPEVFAA